MNLSYNVTFYRSFELPADCKMDQLQSLFTKQGVLRITAPKDKRQIQQQQQHQQQRLMHEQPSYSRQQQLARERQQQEIQQRQQQQELQQRQQQQELQQRQQQQQQEQQMRQQQQQPHIFNNYRSGMDRVSENEQCYQVRKKNNKVKYSSLVTKSILFRWRLMLTALSQRS